MSKYDGPVLTTEPCQPVGLGRLRISFPFNVVDGLGNGIGHTVYVELGSAGLPLPGINLHFEGCGLSSDDKMEIKERLENALLSEYIRRLTVVTR